MEKITNPLQRKAFKIRQWSARDGVKPTDIYITSMTAGEIAGNAGIHRWTRSDRSGYQRPPDKRRLNPDRKGTVTHYLLDELGAFPTSVLINVTGSEVKFSKQDEVDQGIEFGELEIPAGATLTTIDGQHRCEALQQAKRRSGRNFSDYPLPVTIMNVDKDDEVLYFYMVNDRQQGVSTRLTARILQQQLEKEKVPEWFIESSTPMERRKGMAATIVDYLDESEHSPFRGRVAYIDEEVSDQRFIRDYPLISSIEPVLREKTFEGMDEKRIAEHLISYWNALKDMWPDAFDSPADYTLFGTGSMIALNYLFPTAYHVTLEEKGEVSRETIKDFLSPLLKETREHTDDDFRGRITPTFWSKAAGPAVARATSKADARDLYEGLKEKIDLGHS